MAATAVPARPRVVLEVKVIELEVVGVLVDELLPWANVISHQDRENTGKKRENPYVHEQQQTLPQRMGTRSQQKKVVGKGRGGEQLPITAM